MRVPCGVDRSDQPAANAYSNDWLIVYVGPAIHGQGHTATFQLFSDLCLALFVDKVKKVSSHSPLSTELAARAKQFNELSELRVRDRLERNGSAKNKPAQLQIELNAHATRG